MNNSEPKRLGENSNRTLKKIGEIDPNTFEPNKVTEINVRSLKRQKSEKWHVHLDSNTGHLRKSKISDDNPI